MLYFVFVGKLINMKKAKIESATGIYIATVDSPCKKCGKAKMYLGEPLTERQRKNVMCGCPQK